MDKEKKKWETPKLICLYRGRPEEAVLAQCKTSSREKGPGAEKLPCTSGQTGTQCQTTGYS